MCLRRSSRSLCQVYKREILSDFTKNVAGIERMIGNPHINKTDTNSRCFSFVKFHRRHTLIATSRSPYRPGANSGRRK